MLCFILVIAGIIWYREVKEEKRNLYYDNMWCLSRIVTMTVAIERYNIKNIIEYLEEDIIKELIEEKYLSSDFIKLYRNWGCVYKSHGDISTSLGEIYCKKHGNKKELIKKVNDLVKYKK